MSFGPAAVRTKEVDDAEVVEAQARGERTGRYMWVYKRERRNTRKGRRDKGMQLRHVDDVALE